MDDQPRTESPADEPSPVADESASLVAPSDPAATAPPVVALEQPSLADHAPDVSSASRASDAPADLRIHPWQVLTPPPSGPAPITVPLAVPNAADQATAEPAPVELTEQRAPDPQPAPNAHDEEPDDVREREGQAAVLASPAEEAPARERTVAPESSPTTDQLVAGDNAGTLPEAPSIETIETLETVETVELAPDVAEEDAATPLATDPVAPLVPTAARESEPVALVAAQVEAGPSHPGGAGAPQLFTAATVPPGPPGPPERRDDQRGHEVPAIPVDPSAETVPLNSRTDEVAPVARAYPGYPGFAGSPRADGRPGRLAALRQPYTRDAVVRLLTAACGTIVLAAVLGILLTQGEWATGLAAAGIAALLVAGAYLLGTVVRTIAGAGKRGTLRLGLLAAVLFGLLGEAGVYFNGSLHQVQARVLTTVGDYGGAVREYRLAGYLPPNSDLARAYLGWGNALLRRHDYADAATNFQVVVEEYASTPSARDAASGLLAAYDGWMTVGSPTVSYPTILFDLGAVRQAPYCESACMAAADRLTARAHLAFGRLLNGSGDHALAIAQFETVTSDYGSSPYAPVAHANAAITYYLIGQDQLNGTTCSDAVPTYQRLASAYADTPEGATAKSALAAPVQVTGSLTGYPTSPAPVVYLSKTIRSDTYFSDDYSATLDANGAFTFKSVPPGDYNLSAAIPNGSGVYWVDPATHNPYSIAVGPLCPLKLQPYPYS